MKWFLAFLLTNVVTFTYAAVVLYLHFSRLKFSKDVDTSGISFLQSWLTLLRVDVLVGSLFLFVSLCNALVTSFLLYHSYLVFSGVTTNETLKFEDIRQAIKDGELNLYQRSKRRFYLDVAGKPDPVSWQKLENVYDQGWELNFKKIL